jgi:hypothetical protein
MNKTMKAYSRSSATSKDILERTTNLILRLDKVSLVLKELSTSLLKKSRDYNLNIQKRSLHHNG